MSQKVMITRVATVLLMGMALTGCSTMKGWFAGKDAAAKKAQEPAELVKFEPSVKVNKAWSVNLGKGERRIGVREGPGRCQWPRVRCGDHRRRARHRPADRQEGLDTGAAEGKEEAEAAPVRRPGCR